MTRYWTAAIVAVAMLSFGGLRAQDREATFIATAGESGKAEVALAELAQQKAQDPRVRNYAVRLRTDHTSANRELGALATNRRVTIPEPGTEKQEMKKKLEGLSGAEFDRAYMTHMVEAHEKSVELFNETAVSAQGDVQNFARKTLPTLKTHLSDAEELVRSLNSAAAGRESGPAR